MVCDDEDWLLNKLDKIGRANDSDSIHLADCTIKIPSQDSQYIASRKSMEY